MVKYNEEIQLIKDTIGTRQKYHEIITNHDFTDSEKDILLQASANVKSSEIDQELINKAYNILLLKSIINTNKIKNSTTNSPFIKYLLLFGFLFVVFYKMTPNEFEGVNKVDTLKEKETVSKQEVEEPKFGNISGQGFLRTKGGSIRTCAGNAVYIEKSNPDGFIILSEALQNKKSYLRYFESKLHSYEFGLKHANETMLSFLSIAKDNRFAQSAADDYKKQILEYKKNISEVKKKIILAKKEVQEYEEKVKNSVKDNIHQTMCDAQGNYEFSDVKLGKYYITTVVKWYVGDEKQGGIVSKIINVHKGHNKIMLTE